MYANMRVLLLLPLLALWGCASTPMVIQSHEVKVVPPPVVVNHAPVTPYILPADTATLPNGQTVITPADTGFVSVDSSSGTKVAVRVHLHKNALPTISAVIQPDTAHVAVTDTFHVKQPAPEIIHKPTTGQKIGIGLQTIGILVLVLIVLAVIFKFGLPQIPGVSLITDWLKSKIKL